MNVLSVILLSLLSPSFIMALIYRSLYKQNAYSSILFIMAHHEPDNKKKCNKAIETINEKYQELLNQLTEE